MSQPTQKLPTKTPRPNILWIAGLVVVGIFAGSLASRSWTSHLPLKPNSKLGDAIHDLQSGNEKSALSLLKPLADGKDAKAEYWLADIYLNDGSGQKAERASALDLLVKSAGQGFVPAEGRLGEIYMNGDDALQDFAKSQLWLHKAAMSGDVRSQRFLGHTYELGLGAKQDLSQAYGWYENAALSGNVLAQRMRDALLARMSPIEVVKGEEDAKTISKEIGSLKPKPVDSTLSTRKS